ncbi:hypothetical protein V1502_02860 [Bacillus sp. SCS-153A]|uniref:hypothetical protein n=1 Tax=Rossellomorea sedimentorum TaxID=3115294 RepID=UPI0039063749
MRNNNASQNNGNPVIQQQEQVACTRTINQTITEIAEILITPVITPQPAETTCTGPLTFLDEFPDNVDQECDVVVAQEVCVQFDVEFGADVQTGQTGAICGTPDEGECAEVEPGCVFSAGFFSNNETVTEGLLQAAGGEILLGTTTNGTLNGLSVIADANNIFDILGPSFIPPGNLTPPLLGQYRQLYRQLLAAQLNVINLQQQNVEPCAFVQVWIAAANDFLANSPEGGTTGAPFIQERLELFNVGAAPGCPDPCEEENETIG